MRLTRLCATGFLSGWLALCLTGCAPRPPSKSELVEAARLAKAMAVIDDQSQLGPAGAWPWALDLNDQPKSPALPIGPSTSYRPAYVGSAIMAASARTGVPHHLLISTARRESALNPYARAATSSATGLFQFIEETWLLSVQRHGHKYGISALADQIRVDGRGRAMVASAALRREILALRYDAKLSALLGAELIKDHMQRLSFELGRRPSEGELYMAVFLGADGAIKLLRACDHTPAMGANLIFPEAASANPAIFYVAGRPRSVIGVKLALLSIVDH